MGEWEEIELKRDENKSIGISRNEYISVPCHISDDAAKELGVLKEYLEKVGIKLSATRHKDDTSGFTTDILSFAINNAAYKKAVYRNAGRKMDYHKHERYKPCTVAELKEKLETMNKSEIAEELGCQRGTLYRILKNVDFDDKDEQNYSIWSYTS